MDDEHNYAGNADAELTGSDLAANIENLRGTLSTLEQITACLGRLSPGARRRTLERLPDLLAEHGTAVYDMKRIISDYLRRRYP